MTRHAAANLHRLKQKQRQPLDYVIYFFTFTTPLFELPQAYDIYHNHSAATVSLATWSFFAVSSVAFIFYAARQKLLPMIITYTMFGLIEACVVTGILIYR